MALKLKLKVSNSNNSETNANSNNDHNTPPIIKTESSSGLPKLKIKPPSKKSPASISSSSPLGISKKHPHEQKEKSRKLKLSLSLKSSSIKANKQDDTSTRTTTAGPIPSTSSSNSHPKNVPRVRIKPTRVPGDGYDSEAPDVEDDPLIEQGIVIRFLDDTNLEMIQSSVDTGDLSNINIKWITKDKAVVNVNQTLYLARLIDLPTITELYKTIDKKNIFKTFDLCQILLVLKVINPNDLNIERDFEISPDLTYVHPLYSMSPDNEIKNSRNVYKNGLVYPFEGIHRRFRPRKVNHRVMDDIDLKVNALVKADAKAEESHYELIDLSKSHPSHRYGNISSSTSTVATPTSNNNGISNNVEPKREDVDVEMKDSKEGAELQNDVDLLESALQQELEALGSQAEDDNEDEEEEEDCDEADRSKQQEDIVKTEIDTDIVSNSVLGHGNSSEIDNLFEGEMTGAEENEDEEDDDEEEDEEEDEDEEDDEEDEEDEKTLEEKNKAKKLEEEISDLEGTLASQKEQLGSAKNKMLQMKLQANCSTLRGQIEGKKRILSKIREEQQKLQEKLEPNHAQAPELAQQKQDEEDEDDDEDDEEGDEDNLEGLF